MDPTLLMERSAIKFFIMKYTMLSAMIIIAQTSFAQSSTRTVNNISKDKEVLISGWLCAPSGASVILSNNGKEDLSLTSVKDKKILYKQSPIRFTKPLPAGDQFNIALKKIPANMKAVIYSGSGKAGSEKDPVKIGIDYTYEHVSRSNDDAIASSFYETAAPVIGGMGKEEGRYVAFVSWTAKFGGNNSRFRQVFWRDRNTGEVILISHATDGSPANEDCTLPSISADGKTVVFESKANNLVPGDNNNAKDIFIWKSETNNIELVSIPAGKGWGNNDSYDAAISGNGQYVVYTSSASNMTSNPLGRSNFNIFLRDLQNSTTQMISIEPLTQSGGTGSKASISYDGNRITFCSPNHALTINDANNLWDIFLWERNAKALKRISLTHDGKERNQGDESGSRQVCSSISGNGRFVVYSTTATNMVPGDNAKFQDVFVYDIETNKIQVASFTDDGQPGNYDSPIEQGERIATNYDGTWIAFPTKATNLGAPSSNILLFNTTTGKRIPVTDTKGSYVSRPSISYSGSYVIFGKGEPMDKRYSESGIFVHFTGNGPCRDCE